jgi:transposase
MSDMTENPATTPIPVQLSELDFIAFIFPHLSMPRRGPKCKLGYHRVFNLILWVFYTGMQWKCLPVPLAGDGAAMIHYTIIYKMFAKWSDDGSLDQAFIASVRHLAEQHHLDLRVLHGDGSNTVAKKGGDGIGYSGHKHQKGEKVLAIVDNNSFVLAPLPVAPINEADTVLLPAGLNALKRVARLTDLKIDGSYLNLDGGFDSRQNRKVIFNAELVPNIKENPRNRKTPKRGRKRMFNAAVHSLRLCVERTFAWEDK